MNEGKIVEEGTADQRLRAPDATPSPRSCSRRCRSRTRKESRDRRASRWRRVNLPLEPPLKPQLALTRKELPVGEEWAYEPKLDGFRAIVFVDGEESYIQSRGGKALSRYFPELSFAPGRYVIDGELVIRDDDGELEFDALQSRIHPAESRINLLAKEIPAGYMVFDLLAEDDESLLEKPLRERRERLEALAERAGLELTPLTGRHRARPRSGCDRTEGTMAKQLDAPYVPGKRKGMAKVKRERKIDCVVLGWRPGKEEGTVGSLILGLYDGDELRPVGHISGFSAEAKRAMPADAGAAGDRRERHRRAEPLDRRPRARVGRAAAGAGDRSRLRPRVGRANPARGAVSAVPGRQRAAGVPFSCILMKG